MSAQINPGLPVMGPEKRGQVPDIALNLGEELITMYRDLRTPQSIH